MSAQFAITLSDEQMRQLAVAVQAQIQSADEAPNEFQDLVDVESAARIMGVAPKTVRNMLSDGRLQRYGIPRRPRVSRMEIAALMRPRATGVQSQDGKTRGGRRASGQASAFSRAARQG